MTPEQLQRLERLEKMVEALHKVEDVQFLENIIRRIDIPSFLREIRLNDLKDVNVVGVTNGQVIKYTSSTTTWNNANDNTGA